MLSSISLLDGTEGSCGLRYRALAEKALRLYEESGNIEHLVDVANYALLEAHHPSVLSAHFEVLDSAGRSEGEKVVYTLLKANEPRTHARFRVARKLPSEQQQQITIIQHCYETLQFICLCGTPWTWGKYRYGRDKVKPIQRITLVGENHKPYALQAQCTVCQRIHWKLFNAGQTKVLET